MSNQNLLHVYILENDPDYLAFLCNTVRRHISFEEWPAKIEITTTSPDALISNIDQQTANDSIFFLGFGFTNSSKDGVDVALAIRKRSLYADIIFITGHIEKALTILSHKIAPLDLITKDSLAAVDSLVRDDIAYSLQRLRARKLISPRLFSYRKGSKIISFSLNEIIYIQTISGKNRALELHLESETIHFSSSLKDLTLKYPTLFRCHKSILLNPLHVVSLNTSERFAYMDNHERLEVSFRKMVTLRQILR
ncbi:DNA-binding response regulator [Lacticaseibacillus chiayiensis]|uniref:DNA-binding response regulator n=1 Tax=Lacticaseibacillus chiayiensis TaxID=2100821 RepID=A0A4Q1TS62_9LACO|nr:response regulator transcription factor [Lacticaseibacillus chiayiensis]QVI34224.1 response regulator transcription factor [Lacticaseibacillus chiayiensis]RXT20848.1 DNA-binding response regulator [Lacticaseibacillus chiayiensis]RXT55329.1 DNA-binding response regulator [Lacticaseibacillus chiayiensis]UYN56002.1 response regulator transcription factor [Lacticaseibacillus chiayiensis]